MKLNFSNPSTGQQKVVDIDDEKKLMAFYDKRVSQEVEGSCLGEEYNGYVFRISGGNDKQGFPMKQGVLVSHRVRLLLGDGQSCFRLRKNGSRKRKSVRGCIVGPDLAVLNLVVLKKGDADIPGLTDESIPRRLGPKRASKIRKLFALTKDDDVTKYVVKRTFTNKKGQEQTRRPKIQRLVTPLTLQRKRKIKSIKRVAREKASREKAAYSKLHQQRQKEQKEARASEIAKRRSSRRSRKA